MFAPIYNCPEHGDTWQPLMSEIIDTENDDVYKVALCPHAGCRRELNPVMQDGVPVVHALTHEEIMLEMEYWGEDGIESDEYGEDFVF